MRRLLVLAAAAWLAGPVEARPAVPVFRSPLAVAVSPDGRTLYVADKTAGCVTAIDAAAGKPVGDIPIPGEPNGLALGPDGKTLYVAQRKAHAVAVVDTAGRRVTGRIAVGLWPVAVALAPQDNRLYTCNRGDHSVSVVDVASGKEVHRVAVVREPSCAAVTPDGSRLVVTNLLPQGAGTDGALAAEVSILNVERPGSATTGRGFTAPVPVKLPPGSTVVRGCCTSPDGRWAYVVHTLGKFNLPITQLERGWVHTYALSVLDLAAGKRLATLLLDDLAGGAADPWGIVRSADGKTLWISLSGVHEVSRIDIGRVHELLEGKVPDEVAKTSDGFRENVWVRIARDRHEIERLSNDLTALCVARAIERYPSGGAGPRGLALSPDGAKLYLANYFSGTVGVLDTASGRVLGTVPTGPQPAADAARRGEAYFHDATRCFQQWHSCASCHPDGRTDGLPWDFARDGIGNGKDVISLVLTLRTSPHNRRATRPDPRTCMRTGVTGSHLVVPQAREVADLLAYAEALEPEPNPAAPQPAEAGKGDKSHLCEAPSGPLRGKLDLSPFPAGRGKTLFEGKAGCAVCHPAPHFTDRKMHDVGLHSPGEPDGRYDTPSLVEAYRTAPYYHDGRAVTIQEALTTHNPEDKHGQTQALTPQEIEDLAAYVLSL